MPDIVVPSIGTEYRQSSSLALVRGSAPRALVRRDRLHREGHQLALVATKDSFRQDPAFHWLADLRRGRLSIWGGLLRFIDKLVERRVPKEDAADLLAPFIQAYVNEAYADLPPTPPQSTPHRKIA